MPDGHDPYAALRSPDYRRVLIANVLGSGGRERQHQEGGQPDMSKLHRIAINGLLVVVPVLYVLLETAGWPHP